MPDLDLSDTQRKIVEAVRRNAPASRAEVCSRTGFTPGAISKHVRELIDFGLLTEKERRQGLRGQPALPLEIDGSGGVSIGIALPYGRLDAIAIDYTGNVVNQISRPFEGRKMDVLIAIVKPLLSELLQAPEIVTKRISGLGLAVAAALPSDEPRTLQLPITMQWLDIGLLVSELKNICQESVFVENIVNAAALAELYDANSRQRSDIVAINAGYGVGCGLVLAGRIHRGYSGTAGEIGQFFPKDEPRPSARDLLLALRAAGREMVDIDSIGNLDPETDKILHAWIERASTQLSPLVKSICRIVAPQHIAITGMLPKRTAAALATKIKEKVTHSSGLSDFYVPSIEPCQKGTLASAMGAAWLPILDESGPLETRPKAFTGD